MAVLVVVEVPGMGHKTYAAVMKELGVPEPRITVIPIPFQWAK
ncbi:MAG TPA: hypothetical protein VE981_06770 [Planctomycetota bacterium]|nr:hypothetical protein [Planctomycetota bacterium]